MWGASADFKNKSRILSLLVVVILFTVLLPGCKKASDPEKNGKKSTATPKNNGESGSTEPESPSGQPTTAKAALEQLLAGNNRYVEENLAKRDLSKGKLEELAKGQQHPYAVILTCSDSLVAPELLFDQSMGDIYVVRLAGNITDKAGIGSIEYAAEGLKTPLIFVLGHEKCNTVATAAKGDPVTGNMQFLINEIKPAVARAKKLGGELVAKSIDENVRNVVTTMTARSEILDKLVKENKVQIAGGTYSVSTGKITIISDLPKEPEGKPGEQKSN